MCGIIGWSFPAERPIGYTDLALALEELQLRGTDATGVASWVDGELRYQKVHVAAARFDFERPLASSVGVGHTRAATQGSPSDHRNNHPIIAGDIVGAHNGMLWGERATAFEVGVELSYDVDSELLFRIIDKADGDLAEAAKMMDRVEGDAAIVWLDNRSADTLYVAAMGGRPAVWVQTHDGRFVVASTLDAVMLALDYDRTLNRSASGKGYDVEDWGDVPEGDLWVVQGGEIVERRDFAKISWGNSWGRVDTSLADGPGGGGNTKATSKANTKPEWRPDSRPSTKRTLTTTQWRVDHLPFKDHEYAEQWECWDSVEELMDRNTELFYGGSIWWTVRQLALPLEASDDGDLFAYVLKPKGDKVYFVNTKCSGWLPVTRAVVEQTHRDALSVAMAAVGKEAS